MRCAGTTVAWRAQRAGSLQLSHASCFFLALPPLSLAKASYFAEWRSVLDLKRQTALKEPGLGGAVESILEYLQSFALSFDHLSGALWGSFLFRPRDVRRPTRKSASCCPSACLGSLIPTPCIFLTSLSSLSPWLYMRLSMAFEVGAREGG